MGPARAIRWRTASKLAGLCWGCTSLLCISFLGCGLDDDNISSGEQSRGNVVRAEGIRLVWFDHEREAASAEAAEGILGDRDATF